MAAELGETVTDASLVSGSDNETAAAGADVVVVAVPWRGTRSSRRVARCDAGRQGRHRLRQSDGLRRQGGFRAGGRGGQRCTAGEETTGGAAEAGGGRRRGQIGYWFTSGPLGPRFTLSCLAIRRLAGRARADHARLAYAPKLELASVAAQRSSHPGSWHPYPPARTNLADDPVPGGLSLPIAGGTLTSKITVPHTGRYTVWLQGSLTQSITVSVAGRRVGTVSDQIGPGGLWGVVGSVRLPAGVQTIVLRREGVSPLRPAGIGDELGSLALTRNSTPPPVHTLSPSHWRSLCTTPIQWLEIVR